MTDRGLPSADGSPACPFVAFEDDRDERADRPDHRHRCYAEAQPAPRALAHQEAYCLSSAFPVCPTFQEWARREAAHARAGAGGLEGAEDAAVASAGAVAADVPGMGRAGGGGDDAGMDERDPWGEQSYQPPIEERPRRNPPRDWAAPPPWAGAGGPGGVGAAGRGGDPASEGAESERPAIEAGRGLAGSPADRLARGGDLGEGWSGSSSTRARPPTSDSPAAPADPELAGLVDRAARQAREAEAHDEVVPPSRPMRRPTVSSTRDRGRERERERDREHMASEPRGRHEGPSWERQRRHEAYPTIKTRAGLAGFPAVPTVAVLFGGVLLAAIALFFLPALFGVGGPDTPSGGGASPSPSIAVSTPTPAPTPVPEPTPQVYVIKAGDTLSAIAREFNVTLDALLEANKDRISNPNRIQVGDEIIIPLPETEEVPTEASPSPS